jgi:hypothetical protein
MQTTAPSAKQFAMSRAGLHLRPAAKAFRMPIRKAPYHPLPVEAPSPCIAAAVARAFGLAFESARCSSENGKHRPSQAQRTHHTRGPNKQGADRPCSESRFPRRSLQAGRCAVAAWRRAVDGIVGDDALLAYARMMRRRRARVVPVTVVRGRLLCRRGAKRVECERLGV